MRLISFDIDGTMSFGDPPGRVLPEWVRKIKELGHFVGSASDRAPDNQRKVWAETDLEPDFSIFKHKLAELKEQFEADEYWHVGDTEVDEQMAIQAGFEFFWADSFLLEGDPTLDDMR